MSNTETHESYSKKLLASKVSSDPRVQEAKKLLLQAILDHKEMLKGIKPPDPELKISYDTLIEELTNLRGLGNLFYPFIGSGFGNGALVELLDGSVKYDFIGGIGVYFWGHCHQEIIKTSFDAAFSNTLLQGSLEQNADSLELLRLLTDISGLDHCFLTTSGAMANENAFKIAFHKRYPANRLLAFERNFTGRTITAAQITDRPAMREGIPITLPIDYIPFYDYTRPNESTVETVQSLKKYIIRYPGKHAAMIMELVQGEAGFYDAPREFYLAIMEVLREHNVTTIIDEVQTFGRLPSAPFAFQHFGLEEYVDIVTIGKLSQVCATLFNKHHAPKPGLIAQTFTSSTATIKSAFKMIGDLVQDSYFGPQGKIQKLHDYTIEKLQALHEKYPEKIRGPFGIGCMVAFTVFDGSQQNAVSFVKRLYENGVISFTAGSNPTRVRFLLPAGCVSFDDIDNVCKILEETLNQTNSST